MLAVEALRGSNGEDRDGSSDNFSVDGDFAGGTLLEDINFSDLFMGIDDGDMLPGLELDPTETFADFSVGWEEDLGSPAVGEATDGMLGGVTQDTVVSEGEKDLRHGEEATSETTAEDAAAMTSEARSSTPDRGQKSSAAAAAATATTGSQGKRKAKVSVSLFLSPSPFLSESSTRFSRKGITRATGGLDAGSAPEIRAGGGAAGDRQGGAVEDSGADGDRLPHPSQCC
ncbi:hypothetical protein GW17_00039370 [Ensete ventricosum]|nr:hypothetical protein GW17_00039370 [Ensete ventricosum]RZR95846.1 hypothetical protein BHM03_00024738 [Ensete ventricosum]